MHDVPCPPPTHLFPPRSHVVERDWSGIDSKLVAYCSDQTHSSLKKGARICGIRTRTLPTDDNFALQVDAVEAAFAEDVAVCGWGMRTGVGVVGVGVG